MEDYSMDRQMVFVLTIICFGFLTRFSKAQRAVEGCQERSLIGKNVNARYTASSHYKSTEFTVNGKDSRYEPHNAKLNGSYGWAAADNSNPNDFLQIDLGTSRVITAVATQGSGDKAEWVTKYKLNYTTDLQWWTSYKDNQKVKIFRGNNDSHSVVRRDLITTIIARYIRFIPVGFNTHKTMRVDVYGYVQASPNITITSYERSMEISWLAQECYSTNPIKGYTVKVGKNEYNVSGTNLNSFKETKLTPYTKYSVSVRADTKQGLGVWSEAKDIRTAIAVPEVMPSSSISSKAISSASIEVKWTKPNKINGPLKGYNISYTRQGGKDQKFDVVADVTTYNLTSLLAYTTYDISVAVRNTKYTGPPSGIMTVRTMEGVPEIMSSSSISSKAISSTSIEVKWTKPDRDKIKGNLDGYNISYTPHGGDSKSINVGTDVTNYTLTSLLKYTTYSITIAVRNTKYTGQPSTPMTVRTMEDAPSSPLNANGTFIPAHDLVRPQVIITWDKPRVHNGIIRKYTIVYFYNEDTSKKTTVTTNRTSDLKYTVIIFSSGIFSFNISASTVKEGLYATGKNIPIPEYRCSEWSFEKSGLNISNTTYTASSHFNDDRPLNQPDLRYAPYEARLYGSHGWAARDDRNPNDFLQIDLSIPCVITAVATRGSGAGQEWVTTYKLNYTNDLQRWTSYKDNQLQDQLKGNTDSHSVVRRDLENPITARYIRFVPVRYTRHKTMQVDIYVAIQDPPRITSVISSKRSIELTWIIKPCSPTHPIMGYAVKLVSTTGPTHEVIVNGSVFNTTNLKPYTEYYASVKAIKKVRYEKWSNITRIMTKIAEPEAVPVNINAQSASSESIIITWKLEHAELVHGPLKGYKITYTLRGETKSINVKGDVTTYTLTSLLAYTTYDISVAVRNTKYTGPPSRIMTVRTMEDVPEGSPVIIDIRPKTSQSIIIRWKKPDHDTINGELKGYRIIYKPEGGNEQTTDVEGYVTIYELTSLRKYTTYSITIVIRNSKYTGRAGQRLITRTKEDAPSAPVNVNGTLLPALGSDGPRIVMTWNAPRFLNGIIRKYTIVYYYNMKTRNKTIVTINGTRDLVYSMNVTRNGILSYMISATTIKEGPYQSGKNITIALYGRGVYERNIQVGSAASSLTAGLVVGFLLLFLILAFLIWRRTYTRKEIYGATDMPSLHFINNPPSSTATNNVLVDMSEYTDLEIVNIDIESPKEARTRRSSSRSASVKSIKRTVEFPAPDIRKLDQEFKSVPVEPKHECREAKKPSNKEKNRYKNIVAYDHSLVSLEWICSDTQSFYINASFIHGYDGTAEVYIATQGKRRKGLHTIK